MHTSIQRAAKALLLLTLITLIAPSAVFAQGVQGGSTLHYMGAGLGAGIAVIGAGLGIGRLTAAAVESIARQPQAAREITAAFQLPLFLLEGVAVIALAVAFVIIFVT